MKVKSFQVALSTESINSHRHKSIIKQRVKMFLSNVSPLSIDPNRDELSEYIITSITRTAIQSGTKACNGGLGI